MLLPVESDKDHFAACHLHTGAYQQLDPDRKVAGSA